jgi:hypothetical protein
VPDEIWDAAADHYDEQGLAAVILVIATTNFFNRLNATIKEPAGATRFRGSGTGASGATRGLNSPAW